MSMVHTSGRTDHHSRDRLIHWARVYDLGAGLLGRRGNRWRATVADDLQLQSGDQVLDVGCGTGRLAVVFSERVGATGSVNGIDPATEMIKRSTSRARKRGAAGDLPGRVRSTPPVRGWHLRRGCVHPGSAPRGRR